MQNIFEVVSFDWLFWVEKLEEVLDELRCHVDFQTAHFNWLMNYQLKEKFVDAL